MHMKELNWKPRFFFPKNERMKILKETEAQPLRADILDSPRRFYFGFVESHEPFLADRLPLEMAQNPEEDWGEVFEYWEGCLNWEIIFSAVEAPSFLKIEEECGICDPENKVDREHRRNDFSEMLKEPDQGAQFAIYLDKNTKEGQELIKAFRLSTWHLFCLHDAGLPIIKSPDEDFLDLDRDYFEAVMEIDERALVRLTEIFSLNHVPSAFIG